MSKSKNELKTVISKEVAESCLSVKVQGDKIKQLNFSGTYRVIMKQLVCVIVAMFINFEKAYGIKPEASLKMLKDTLDKVAEVKK